MFPNCIHSSNHWYGKFPVHWLLKGMVPTHAGPVKTSQAETDIECGPTGCQTARILVADRAQKNGPDETCHP